MLRLVSLLPLCLWFLLSASVYASSGEAAIRFEAANGELVDAFSGQLQVPENRNDPDSRPIMLKYVRFPGIGSSPGFPIVYLAGGPGGSGIETARHSRFPLFMAMREFGDVIALDQRGTGASDQLPECISEFNVPDRQRLSDEQFDSRYRNAAKACFDFWHNAGVDVGGYTTQQSALDLAALRQHLGAEKISLWGISYGSHLSLAAIKAMPKQIDRVMLASVEGLDQTVKLPARTDAYFQRLQAAINSHETLAIAHPDIAVLMRRVHARLEADPLMLTLSYADGRRVPYLLEVRDLQVIASAMISDPPGALTLIRLYAGLDAGSTQELSELLARFHTPDEPISFRAMPLAMDIASGINAERLEQVRIQAESSLLADYLNFPMPLFHDVKPDLDLGESFRKPAVSDIPVLVFSGTLDGRTYPESQIEAVAGLSNVQLITVRNAGHNLFMSSPEVAARMKSFLRGDRVETSDIVVMLGDR